MRDTKYAREIVSVIDEHGQSIERIHVKEPGQDEIRFSFWKDGNMVVRPLDLPEDQLLALLDQAFQTGVFTADFRKKLHGLLYDHRGN